MKLNKVFKIIAAIVALCALAAGVYLAIKKLTDKKEPEYFDDNDFFECKYYDRKMTLEECRQEEKQVMQQPGLTVSRVGFVCTGGFDFQEPDRYTLIDGEALYRIMD